MLLRLFRVASSSTCLELFLSPFVLSVNQFQFIEYTFPSSLTAEPVKFGYTNEIDLVDSTRMGLVCSRTWVFKYVKASKKLSVCVYASE